MALTLLSFCSNLSSLPCISPPRSSSSSQPSACHFSSYYLPSWWTYGPWILKRNKNSSATTVPSCTNDNSLPSSSSLCDDDQDDDDNDDHQQALQAVLKLYDAIKNKNIHELSDMLGDECRCVCGVIPFFCRSFQGKEQVLAFFSYLIKTLGNNIRFVVQPTTHDGMTVGVQWKLEWRKKHTPLGKGFGVHICQMYQGRVFISNVEIFVEPLLRMEHFRLAILGFLESLVDEICSYTASFKSEAKRARFAILLALLSVAAFFLFLKFRMF